MKSFFLNFRFIFLYSGEGFVYSGFVVKKRDVWGSCVLKNIFAFSICFSFLLSAGYAMANTKSFDEWLIELRGEALEKGINPQIISTALPTGMAPIERVIELDRKQPEGKMSFVEYRGKIVNSARIRKGRQMMRRYRSELNAVSEEYDVQPQYIVALWGIETNFGNNTGGFDVVHALATLAYDGRRGEYFRGELLKALQILDEGHITPADMKGSWAGAMGQSQFMPSSFLNYAEDFNSDGRRDIWNTKEDVFASAANYLKSNGWVGDETWGREVQVPANLAADYEGLKVKKSLKEWQRLGVRKADGTDLPHVDDMPASLVQPDGRAGPSFLVYNNYRTVMRWNRSTYFATSVGLLANAISGY